MSVVDQLTKLFSKKKPAETEADLSLGMPDGSMDPLATGAMEASGNTTVPMSRPTMTRLPGAAIRRCCSTMAARTPRLADGIDTLASTAGDRNSQVTSSPSSMTVD